MRFAWLAMIRRVVIRMVPAVALSCGQQQQAAAAVGAEPTLIDSLPVAIWPEAIALHGTSRFYVGYNFSGLWAYDIGGSLAWYKSGVGGADVAVNSIGVCEVKRNTYANAYDHDGNLLWQRDYPATFPTLDKQWGFESCAAWTDGWAVADPDSYVGGGARRGVIFGWDPDGDLIFQANNPFGSAAYYPHFGETGVAYGSGKIFAAQTRYVSGSEAGAIITAHSVTTGSLAWSKTLDDYGGVGLGLGADDNAIGFLVFHDGAGTPLDAPRLLILSTEDGTEIGAKDLPQVGGSSDLSYPAGRVRFTTDRVIVSEPYWSSSGKYWDGRVFFFDRSGLKPLLEAYGGSSYAYLGYGLSAEGCNAVIGRSSGSSHYVDIYGMCEAQAAPVVEPPTLRTMRIRIR